MCNSSERPPVLLEFDVSTYRECLSTPSLSPGPDKVEKRVLKVLHVVSQRCGPKADKWGLRERGERDKKDGRGSCQSCKLPAVCTVKYI